MEKAAELNLCDIWIETDSLSVLKAFNNHGGVTWRMRIRWLNCLSFCRQIRCFCTHILREGNLVVDALAKNGQSLAPSSSQWWESPPSFILSLLYRDSLGLPVSRVCMN
jgi:ribonuclease HI